MVGLAYTVPVASHVPVGGTSQGRHVNACQGVECNHGTCVNGVQSFTCQCQEGYTGQFCDVKIDTTPPVRTINTTPDGDIITPRVPI